MTAEEHNAKLNRVHESFFHWCVGFTEAVPSEHADAEQLALDVKNRLSRMNKFAKVGMSLTDCVGRIRDDFWDV